MGMMWFCCVVSYMIILILSCKQVVQAEEEFNDDESSHISRIWEKVVENEMKSRKMRGSGRYGRMGGMDAESNIVGGDIVIDPEEPIPSKMIKSRTMLGRIGDAEMMAMPLFTWHQRLWLTREIPYIITPSSANQKKVIREGINGLRQSSCLKFREEKRRRKGDDWWLEFFYGNGCHSGIGRKYWRAGQPTRISIGRDCNFKDIVMHEILHALGFAHEQSRTDRDRYVKIRFANVLQGFSSNFKKSDLTEGFYFGTPYDYRSIMHYGKGAFANGRGKITIQPTKRGAKLGGKVLSPGDIKELNLMYQCKKRDGWSDWINTPCMCTKDKKYCTKSKVRMCFGKRKCSGENQRYGTQFRSENCKASAEGKGGNTGWSRWSSYGTCSSKCGWGFQERTRKRMKAFMTEVDHKAQLCRRKRCSSAVLGSDSGARFTKWSKTRFSRTRGYVSASGKSGYLKSKNFKTTKEKKMKCIMFKYKMRSSTFELRQQFKSKYETLFRKTGSTSEWKRAAVTVPTSSSSHKLVFKVSTSRSRNNFASVADVFVDLGRCPWGLNVCRNVKKSSYCRSRGGKGYCNHSNESKRRRMYHECCGTCEEASYRNKEFCEDQNKLCKKWAKSGECKKNSKWMSENCAPSCGVCTAPRTPICKDSDKRCKNWAKDGECKKNANWMLKNCQKSCGEC